MLKRKIWKIFGLKMCVFGLVLFVSSTVHSTPFDGQVDNARDDLGLYYAITGGKFPTGQTPNGDNASGGTFRFLTDDPDSGYTIDQWHKDDWFSENAGLAMTFQSNGTTIYDNNGIEDGTYGDYYDDAASGSVAGLYMAYSMSNNYDWIYSGYFKIEETVTVDRMIGYFDGTGYYGNLDPDNPELGYRMNIWSNVSNDLIPFNTGGFEGDVFSSDAWNGSFSWSDTGVDRVYSGWNGATDDIYRLVFDLDVPLTLEAGEYWFSHDAVIVEPVPEPSTIILMIVGFAVLLSLRSSLIRKRFIRSRPELNPTIA